MRVKNLGTTAVAAALTALTLQGELNGSSIQSIGFQAIATGDLTAATIDIEASLDNGITWSIIDTYAFVAGDITNKHAMFYVTDKPATDIRVNISTLTFTTSGDITVRMING